MISGDTSYSESGNATATSVGHEDANPVTGDYTINASFGSTSFTQEYLEHNDTLATINTTVTTTSSLDTVGDSINGDYTVTSGFHSTLTRIRADGTDGSGSYDFTKTAYTEKSWDGIGDSIAGTYTNNGDYLESSTAIEANTYTAGSADFTEVIHESYDFTETGDGTGDYTLSTCGGERWSTLNAFTSVSSGDYTVTQETVGDFNRIVSGNRATGEYLQSETASDNYTVIQKGTGTANFTLTMTGTNSYSDEDDGNTVTGEHIRTKNGTDNFTITIVGTKTGGAYNQLVTGTESYTLVDNGNPVTEHYEREIDVDSSSYTRSSSGPGATKPSDSGSTNYHWEQTGDPHSGTFDLAKTGISRYDLLEDFFDISNTGGGQTPGHMNVFPFGQTFVDPSLTPAELNELNAILRIPAAERTYAQAERYAFLFGRLITSTRIAAPPVPQVGETPPPLLSRPAVSAPPPTPIPERSVGSPGGHWSRSEAWRQRQKELEEQRERTELRYKIIRDIFPGRRLPGGPRAVDIGGRGDPTR